MTKKQGQKIRISKPEKVSINSALFAEFRDKFDAVLNDGIKKIVAKGIPSGKFTIGFDIDLEENDSEDTPDMDTYIPVINYKLTFAYTEKSSVDGATGGADVQMISQDKGKTWYVRNDPYGQQEMDLD